MYWLSPNTEKELLAVAIAGAAIGASMIWTRYARRSKS